VPLPVLRVGVKRRNHQPLIVMCLANLMPHHGKPPLLTVLPP
jgi:hypothetical protein